MNSNQLQIKINCHAEKIKLLKETIKEKIKEEVMV